MVVHAQLLIDSLIHSADVCTFSCGVGGLCVYMRIETPSSLLKKTFISDGTRRQQISILTGWNGKHVVALKVVQYFI